MEQSEDSSDLKERFETISEYLRKKEAYDAAYPNQPSPQDPYLTDSAKVKENQNSQVYRQGDYNNQEIPGNSQMNQEKKENYDKSRIPSDEHYKNSQLYGSSYSSSKQPVSQVNQAVKPTTANERNQNEDYYKNVQNYVNAYIDPKTPQSQDSTKDVGVQVDNGQKSQQNSTSASPQYSYIKQVTSEPYVRVQSDYKNPQAYSNLATQSPQLNEGYRAGYQSGNQSTMLLHYPDHNPVLLPHQKITINIEYPTENYNNNVCKFKYLVTRVMLILINSCLPFLDTTRAPLKRPTKISHTTTKNPNESFRP